MITEATYSRNGRTATIQVERIDTWVEDTKSIVNFPGIVELDGRSDNIQPIWAWRDAQRYGARAVFFADCDRVLDRKTSIADLREGLDPVCDAERARHVA